MIKDSVETRMKKNYLVFQNILAREQKDGLYYHLLRLMYAQYCQSCELRQFKEQNSLYVRVKGIVKSLLIWAIYPFFEYKAVGKSEVMLLPAFWSDYKIADHLEYPVLSFERKFVFRWSALRDGVQCGFALLRIGMMSKMHFGRVIELMGPTLTGYKHNRQTDISGIKMILLTDDVSPIPVGILQNAKRNGIESLKYDFALKSYIDANVISSNHYFYPSKFHLDIYQSVEANKDISYICGGYVNVNFEGVPTDIPRDTEPLIVYFTAHFYENEFDDNYYIAQILEHRPDNYRLAIKVHPYDTKAKYDEFKHYSNIDIYDINDIDNGELIARSSFCFSICSTMSIEAKHVCANSYFLNYSWRNSMYEPDFKAQQAYFEIIDTPEFLYKVLHGCHTPISSDLFKLCDNMTSPNTFKVLKMTINKLLALNDKQSTVDGVITTLSSQSYIYPNKKKIVFIDHEPLSIRRRQIFYIDELRAAGFDVEFWDCSQYVHKGMLLTDTLEDIYVQKMNSLAQIKQALHRTDINNAIFIVEMFQNWQSRHFFRLLSKNRCCTVRQEMYATATLPSKQRTFRQIIELLCERLSNHPITFVKSVMFRFYKRLYPFEFSRYICSGNRTGTDLHINHPDWEIYKNIKKGAPIVEGRYAVFIDEFFPQHPDLLFFEGRKVGDVAKYHRLMNDFFTHIEQEHNLEVVIAAHPKAEYDNDAFGGRKTIKYHSAELIRDAQMVFMHGSAAISYVMMFDKPLALIYTDDYKAMLSQFEHMQRISRMTSLPLFNIEAGEKVSVSSISTQCRENYIYSYLTSPGIENSSNSDLLINYLSTL